MALRNPAAQGRPDANHGEIVGWYEALYCSVLDLHSVGFGCSDVLIGCAGVNDLVEIKTEDGELEPSQVRFNRDWRGRRPIIVRTQDDVIKHVISMRNRTKE